MSLDQTLPRKLVLVADDDTTVRKTAMAYISKFYDNVEFIEARHGEDAIDRINETIKSGQSIDIALCDFQMPYKNGIEVLAHLREYSPKTYRLMMSAKDKKTISAAAPNFSDVVQELMQKPVSPDAYERIIGRALRKD